MRNKIECTLFSHHGKKKRKKQLAECIQPGFPSRAGRQTKLDNGVFSRNSRNRFSKHGEYKYTQFYYSVRLYIKILNVLYIYIIINYLNVCIPAVKLSVMQVLNVFFFFYNTVNITAVKIVFYEISKHTVTTRKIDYIYY